MEELLPNIPIIERVNVTFKNYNNQIPHQYLLLIHTLPYIKRYLQESMTTMGTLQIEVKITYTFYKYFFVSFFYLDNVSKIAFLCCSVFPLSQPIHIPPVTLIPQKFKIAFMRYFLMFTPVISGILYKNAGASEW